MIALLCLCSVTQLKSGPCAYDSKYLSQIDRFCDRAVKYGYIVKFTSTALGSEIKSAEGGGGGGGGGGGVRIKNEMF